jgi:hypothetical protein
MLILLVLCLVGTSSSTFSSRTVARFALVTVGLIAIARQLLLRLSN